MASHQRLEASEETRRLAGLRMAFWASQDDWRRIMDERREDHEDEDGVAEALAALGLKEV